MNISLCWSASIWSVIDQCCLACTSLSKCQATKKLSVRPQTSVQFRTCIVGFRFRVSSSRQSLSPGPKRQRSGWLPDAWVVFHQGWGSFPRENVTYKLFLTYPASHVLLILNGFLKWKAGGRTGFFLTFLKTPWRILVPIELFSEHFVRIYWVCLYSSTNTSLSWTKFRFILSDKRSKTCQ